MDSSDPGDLTAPFQLKGIRHGRPLRVEKDPLTGAEVEIYELMDDEFPPDCAPVDERGRKI